MVVNADKIGASSTTSSDSRITPVGKFLRKYKLDELPQMFNVLGGSMSVVGPRPDVKQFTDMFTEEELDILKVKPGITDYASVWNADEGSILEGAADPDKAYLELIWPEKKRLQLKYVRERSFWVDIKIVFLTLQALIKK
jgi:lipopolysaccharide/colanic/teichoic acid biosynthesis glycosyltransferase